MKILIAIAILALSLSASAAKMQWYKSSIESAFQKAYKTKTPLFLYWGAQWCPPCNQMKKTVFSTDIFQKEARNFIAVYLDGDTKEAQTWGEKLKGHGYPTMMILNPNGVEITRLPTGIDAVSYVSLMQKARSSMTPISKLLKKKRLSDNEWSLLSLYSWNQDPESSTLENFQRLYKSAPLTLKAVKSRLFLLLTSKKVQGNKDYKLTQVEKNKLLILLKDQKLVYQNREMIIESFSPIAKTDLEIQQQWLKSINILKSKKLTLNEQISMFIPELETQKVHSEELKESIIKKSKEIEKQSMNPFERHSALTTSIWLLKRIGEYDLAYKFALEESKKSKFSYYYMSYLASIEKERKKIDQYLLWKKKAWKASTGSAARFQWGTSYLISLIEQKREFKFAEEVFSKIISENIKNKDAFKGRNKRRMQRIVDALSKSKKKESQSLIFRNILKTKCKTRPYKDCGIWIEKLKL